MNPSRNSTFLETPGKPSKRKHLPLQGTNISPFLKACLKLFEDDVPLPLWWDMYGYVSFPEGSLETTS